MAIWDGLPPEERRKYIYQRLTPGRVVLLHCDFTNPPKDKYLLLAGLDPGPLFLIINSKITEFMRRRPDLSKCQVEIDHNDHPFLRHHSFIDCTEAYRIGLNEIYAQLEGDVNRI